LGKVANSGLGPTEILPYQIVELLIVGAEKLAQLGNYVRVDVGMLPAFRIFQTFVRRVVFDAVKPYDKHTKILNLF